MSIGDFWYYKIVPKLIAIRLRIFDIEYLRLDYKKLSSLPLYLKNNSNIRYLYLDDNNINVLPDWIDTLTNLRLLSLSHNKILTIPIQISNLTDLEELLMRDCRLSEIPNEIFNIKSLKKLSIYGNIITFISQDLKKLKSLEILEIGNNNLTELPEEIGELKNLKELRIDYNPLLSIPSKLYSLPQLTQISFGNYFFEEIPKFEFPDSIVKLKIKLSSKCKNFNDLVQFKNFRELEINGNLPNYKLDLSPIPRLTKLSIIDCGLRKVPGFLISLKSLTHLDLSNNLIHEIPAFLSTMSSLEELVMNHNQISSIPNFLQYTSKLINVRLNYNNISYLPLWLFHISNFNQIYISGIRKKVGATEWKRQIYIFENPILFPPKEILNKFGEDKKKLIEYIGTNITEYEYTQLRVFETVLKLSNELIIPIKQYLFYFKEYIKNKGFNDVEIDIIDVDNVIIIKSKVTDGLDYTDFNELIVEYISLLQESSSNIKEKVFNETFNKHENEFNLKMILVEINSLKEKVRLLNNEKRLLREENSFFKKLISSIATTHIETINVYGGKPQIADKIINRN